MALFAGCGGEEEPVVKTVSVPDKTPKVVAVVVTTKSIVAAPGDTVSLSAEVITVHEDRAAMPLTGVTWHIDENSTAYGGIDQATGEVTVRDDAALEQTITVTAQSAVDPQMRDTATITVSHEANIQKVGITGGAATVKRGSEQQFSAVVRGKNNTPLAQEEVDWHVNSVVSGFSGDVLRIDEFEPATLLTITASSATDGRVSGQAVVRIPTIEEVTVLPQTANLEKGGTLPFYAVVGGFALDGLTAGEKALTWNVAGASNTAETAIGTDGLLTAATDESGTDGKLTVTAVSGYGGVSGSAQVTVSDIQVTLGRISAAETFGTTTKLTFYFSRSINGLSADAITITDDDGTGIRRGNLQAVEGANGVYELAVSGIKKNGTVQVVADNVPGYTIGGSPQNVAVSYGNIGSIKVKLGVSKEGKDGVTEAFTALHAFIQSGGLTTQPDLIRLGDYIDLESLTVAAINNDGGINASNTAITLANPPFSGYAGRLLRLIVVGINSFQQRAGYSYMPPANSTHNTTPHVVFHFQNVPGLYRMETSSINTNGYLNSSARTYLVGTSGTNGNFITGLANAGVPLDILWAPTRYIAASGSASTTQTIADKLWLPTEWEMSGKRTNSNPVETAQNQAWLEYYTDNNKRKKYVSDGLDKWHWTASPANGNTTHFCGIGGLGDISIAPANSNYVGSLPAFCVY